MRIIVFMVTTFLMICVNSTAFACSCVGGSGYIADYAGKFDVIFLGTPIKIETQKTFVYKNGPQQAHFEIKSFFKGVNIPNVNIITNTYSSCDFNFLLAKEYVVFANRNKSEELVTNLCAMTAFSHADSLEYFQQGIDKNHVNREQCFLMIKEAYDVEALGEKFELEDERCSERIDEYDRAYR